MSVRLVIVAVERMVEDTVAVVWDAGHLEVMAGLAECVANTAFDLQG